MRWRRDRELGVIARPTSARGERLIERSKNAMGVEEMRRGQRPYVGTRRGDDDAVNDPRIAGQ
jgi:hypothetical protein